MKPPDAFLRVMVMFKDFIIAALPILIPTLLTPIIAYIVYRYDTKKDRI